MNTKYFARFAGIILAWLFTGCFLPSTINDKPRTFAETDDKVISDMRQQGLNKSDPFYLNEINTRVVRSFVSNYWNATNATWVPYLGGFAVFFINEGIPHRVYYTKTGFAHCIIRQYSEKDLPRDIRHMVRSAYYDYSIFLVNEVTSMGKTYYAIKLEDKTSFKELKIDDSGLEVTNEFLKSK